MNFIKEMKNKKNILWLVLAIVSMLALGFGVSVYQENSKEKALKLKNITYEVLDESVLSEDVLKKWVEENKKNEGVYQTSNDKYTFVIISGGEKETTGYGIALNGVEGTKKQIKIQYQVIAPENPGISKNEKSYPSMVIRYLKDSRTVVGEVTKDKK